ncbi:hypothetical protein DYU11_22695 [Fibrisoma montanum]|uniref:DNA methylase N-4/N-6 domain-containing protein n=1 Tax=Fibrisoma montanum TaxID=2305895 RepID=A0A418M206_9BACT|nr:hypothetical protein [Fibrisoma montanum]RIV19741.1 hypothetical protein DYU11_22695 [Fibrisoma montanum]
MSCIEQSPPLLTTDCTREVSIDWLQPTPSKAKQKKLFRQQIMSVSYDQNELLQNIIELHLPEGIQVDATYGYGQFYTAIPRPEYCFDIAPKKPEAVVADSRQLPLAAGTIRSIMFDPPFVVTNHKTSDEYVMGKKYGAYRTITQLREHYKASLDEFARVLRPYGMLVFKCQDFVHGRKNYFIHNEVLELAKEAGFKPVDLFILLAKNRFNGAVNFQNHARKFHSYFWVFKRSGKKDQD